VGREVDGRGQRQGARRERRRVRARTHVTSQSYNEYFFRVRATRHASASTRPSTRETRGELQTASSFNNLDICRLDSELPNQHVR
jgi:hypothetical protein